MGFIEYEQSMHDGLVKFTNIVDKSTKVHVRNVHENPLGNMISSCPPTDWRNPEVVRIYNELLLETCTRLKLPFVDTILQSIYSDLCGTPLQTGVTIKMK